MRLTTTLFFTTMLAVGCGELAPGDGSDATLETLNGRISNSQNLPIQGQVRVALIWFGMGEVTQTEGDVSETRVTQINVAQDIPVSPQFPATFSLNVVAAPPAEVMFGEDGPFAEEAQSWPAGATMAFGTLVVYEDTNGNGQLDLLEEGATQTIDTILGAREDLGVMYFEGAVPISLFNEIYKEMGLGQAEGTPKLGFNLIEFNFCMDPADTSCQMAFKWYEEGEVFDLPLTLDPEMWWLICQTAGHGASGSGWNNDMGTQQPPTYPAPDEVTCVDGGRSYMTEEECTTTQLGGLCGETHTSCVHKTWHVPDPAAPPVGWPCTIESL